jgi:hypothetical protein
MMYNPKPVRHARPTFMNQRSCYRLFCVCADEHKICAVALDGVGFEKCHSVVLGIFLMTAIELLYVTFLSII